MGRGVAAGPCPPQGTQSSSPLGTSRLVQGTGRCLGVSQLPSIDFLLIIWGEKIEEIKIGKE